MCIFIHQVRLLKKWRPLKKLTHFWQYAVVYRKLHCLINQDISTVRTKQVNEQ